MKLPQIAESQMAQARDEEMRRREMKKLADLQLRLDIEQEARRRFYGG